MYLPLVSQCFVYVSVQHTFLTCVIEWLTEWWDIKVQVMAIQYLHVLLEPGKVVLP